MGSVILLAAIAIIPRLPVVETRVDVIEQNHFYSDDGDKVFTQLIYYDWCDDSCRFQVRAWRLASKPGMVPIRNGHVGYSTTWLDGNDLRRVYAGAWREAWTQHDPELLERGVMSREQRRELGTNWKK